MSMPLLEIRGDELIFDGEKLADISPVADEYTIKQREIQLYSKSGGCVAVGRGIASRSGRASCAAHAVVASADEARPWAGDFCAGGRATRGAAASIDRLASIGIACCARFPLLAWRRCQCR